MSMLSSTRSGVLAKVAAVIIGLALGVGLALLVGQALSPFQRYDPTPFALRRDYKDEYIRLIALAYQVDDDLVGARNRLELLRTDGPAVAVVELAERWVGEGKSRQLIAPLIPLARDLGAVSATLAEFERQGVP